VGTDDCHTSELWALARLQNRNMMSLTHHFQPCAHGVDGPAADEQDIENKSNSPTAQLSEYGTIVVFFIVSYLLVFPE